jgi:uncharacterized protein
VNPFFIGTADRRLFAIYEPAAPGGRPRAAVLCYPWGIEYTYAHRSMRQLARKLSMSGCHTLRFDYFGTGDSAGEASEPDLPGSQSDVESAIEAAKEVAGTSKVALVGLRMGANIAASVASRRCDEVEALVLWDPIVPAGQPLQGLQMAWPDRSLILVTERLKSHHELGHGNAESAKQVQIEFATAPCPWIESATTTGALPVRIIQRIEEWLR